MFPIYSTPFLVKKASIDGLLTLVMIGRPCRCAQRTEGGVGGAAEFLDKHVQLFVLKTGFFLVKLINYR